MQKADGLLAFCTGCLRRETRSVSCFCFSSFSCDFVSVFC